jgi:hypothetical protein
MKLVLFLRNETWQYFKHKAIVISSHKKKTKKNYIIDEIK